MMAVETQPRVVGNFSAESALIGAMMCDAKIIDSIADMLEPEDFSEQLAGHIFSVIVREHSLGRSANPVTLRAYLDGDACYEELGGFAWLASLTEQPSSLIGAKSFAAQIRDLAVRRRLIEGLRETIALAEDPNQTPDQLMEAADSALAHARETGDGIHQPTGAQCLDEVIAGFDAPLSGVECGIIPSIDKLLGPMRPKHLIIGGGRPGMGKTATAVSYALGAASRGHGVLFFSLEMGSTELGERMASDLCLESRIPYETIRDGRLSAAQKVEVCRARERLADMPLVVIDKGGMKIGQMTRLARTHARRMAAKGQKLELIIVDYLQLLRPDHRMNSPYEAVSEISRTLKEIAKAHEVAVFALTQMSREVEKRADKRPQLSDLRDSGQIEQDADAVIFFLRDEYYLRLCEVPENDPKRASWEKALEDCQGRIEFICAKRRNGRTGSLRGEFLAHYQAVRG